MGFFAENRAEWLLTEIACISDAIIIAPIPSRSADASSVLEITRETEVNTLCVSNNTLPLILDMVENGQLPHLKNLINFDDYSQELTEHLSTFQGLNFLTYASLLDTGKRYLNSRHLQSGLLSSQSDY